MPLEWFDSAVPRAADCRPPTGSGGTTMVRPDLVREKARRLAKRSRSCGASSRGRRCPGDRCRRSRPCRLPRLSGGQECIDLARRHRAGSASRAERSRAGMILSALDAVPDGYAVGSATLSFVARSPDCYRTASTSAVSGPLRARMKAPSPAVGSTISISPASGIPPVAMPTSGWSKAVAPVARSIARMRQERASHPVSTARRPSAPPPSSPRSSAPPRPRSAAAPSPARDPHPPASARIVSAPAPAGSPAAPEAPPRALGRHAA